MPLLLIYPLLRCTDPAGHKSSPTPPPPVRHRWRPQDPTPPLLPFVAALLQERQRPWLTSKTTPDPASSIGAPRPYSAAA
uniref:Uncharacterized protein n=1 Tax=Arundo donax TaxID=35708 RepID=A0A0A9CW91_ARUDO